MTISYLYLWQIQTLCTALNWDQETAINFVEDMGYKVIKPKDETLTDDMTGFEGGGVRSSDEGKPDFSLLLVSDLEYADQVLTRAALRMAEGGVKYGARNHELMRDLEAFERCKSSMLRHMMQYLNGETDEDHLAAVVCNAVMVSGIEKRVNND